MIRLVLIGAVLAVTGLPAAESPFLERTYDKGGSSLPYRLYVPKTVVGQRYPVVIWLHDVLGVGRNNKRQISFTDAIGVSSFTRPESQSRYPAFVLAPQCPIGSAWVNWLWKTPSEPLFTVLDILDELEHEYPVDRQRIYLVGQSMGAYGVWALLSTRPDLFAAAVPVSGGGNPALAPLMAAVPIWAFHGGRDWLVRPSRSRRMIEAIREAGGSPRYTEYRGVGHTMACWKRAFSEPDLLPWLFSKRRNF